jgi:hypothetical protein
VSSLPDYKSTFPQWSSQDLGRIVDTLDEVAIDFLNVRAFDHNNLYLNVNRRVSDFFMQRSLVYDSAKRISGMSFLVKSMVITEFP